jgi:hypothetical protein
MWYGDSFTRSPFFGTRWDGKATIEIASRRSCRSFRTPSFYQSAWQQSRPAVCRGKSRNAVSAAPALPFPGRALLDIGEKRRRIVPPIECRRGADGIASIIPLVRKLTLAELGPGGVPGQLEQAYCALCRRRQLPIIALDVGLDFRLQIGLHGIDRQSARSEHLRDLHHALVKAR